ncbi:MAG TPA: permease [Acidimicrobiales bacterium]|nr:permease [Acidimicrobiales bacterium]
MHADLFATLTFGRLLLDVGRSLREGFFMFWETLWALVLGFTLSGFVQAFVSKEQLQAKLGTHRPSAVGRAAGYGMVSSSCSYAATAMAKSLFVKGADFVSAMVFMIASTNLVVELGIVMLVLLGWQFMVAEFVGGPIMILLLALTGGWVFSRPLVDAARQRLANPQIGGHDHAAMTGVSMDEEERLERSSWRAKLRSPAAWSDASSYAIADVTMLRKELAIGYTVAGFLAVLVPTHLWNLFFIHGHGLWTSVENALVGPLIAVISWVCSIGNVPLAAALWSGGISFGGVIAFIFADLIAMPLILIYRKFYGGALTVRIVGLFYVIMAVAGLLTEGVFSLFHAVPSKRILQVTSAHFEWNYTSYLNVLFIALAVVVWWLARNQRRFGGGQGYAIDPVCGMQIRKEDAPARTSVGIEQIYFCSDRCRERFEAQPERYAAGTVNFEPMPPFDDASIYASTAIDPVCGMTVNPATAAAHRTFNDVEYWFCNPGCAETFDANPGRYVKADPMAENP